MHKESIENLARERIKQLFSEAEKNPKLADRYVGLARKIAMKARMPIPRGYKRKFCKYCNSYFISKKVRIRTKNSKVVYYCLICRKYTRYPMIKEKLIKKKLKK